MSVKVLMFYKMLLHLFYHRYTNSMHSILYCRRIQISWNSAFRLAYINYYSHFVCPLSLCYHYYYYH